MGSVPRDGKPIKLNGAFHTLSLFLRCVVASAAVADLGALFMNCKEGMIFKATLDDLGHPQPPIPVHCDNAAAVSIATNTIKRQRLRAMEMKYFWTCEKDAQKVFFVKMAPRNGKSCGLPKQTPHRGTTHGSKTVLFAGEKFPLGTSPCNMAEHSERVCWNPKRWVCT
jgi:hypothetical protein